MNNFHCYLLTNSLLPEVEGRLVLLKTPHTIDTEPPWGLAFMVPEGTMQTSKGEKQLAVLPFHKTYKPQRSLVQYDNFKGAVVEHIRGQ